MVAIYVYEAGLKFTGWIANSKEEAWAYLDEKYGRIIKGYHCGCNRNAFHLEEAQLVVPTKIDTSDD